MVNADEMPEKLKGVQIGRNILFALLPMTGPGLGDGAAG